MPAHSWSDGPFARSARAWRFRRSRPIAPEPGVGGAVGALMLALSQRDRAVAEHSERVGACAREVGERLGLAPDELADLELAGLLHDVGKIGIPDAILHKRGPLDDREWGVMCAHADRGAEIVSRIPELEGIADLVRHAHERWDGLGYPHGLAGEEIPFASRVILAADALDAMRFERPYRAALDPGVVERELLAGSGSQFDPAVVDASLALL
jgi:HD-GYP domain-containing protein (c-di-GMP phosphodiesterase class II)